jgi:hypothetical protein
MRRSSISGGTSSRLGSVPTPATGTVSAQLEDHFRQRVAALPETTQELLLLAAADSSGDATLTERGPAAPVDRPPSNLSDSLDWMRSCPP